MAMAMAMALSSTSNPIIQNEFMNSYEIPEKYLEIEKIIERLRADFIRFKKEFVTLGKLSKKRYNWPWNRRTPGVSFREMFGIIQKLKTN